jgi:periplasmic divalent cation tolerance protein
VSEARLIYSTVPDQACGDTISRSLVEERLAACTNLLPGMRSCYRWQGELCQDDEFVLLIKTVAGRVDACLARLAELHPYDEPCGLVLPAVGGLPGYLDWISAETAID